MVEADLNGWFDRKQTEPDSASGHLFRIRIDGIRDEDPPSVHSVSREVAARVRELLRRQVADSDAGDVRRVRIESCAYGRRDGGLVDELARRLSPWNDPGRWNITDERVEVYAVESFIAAEHRRELSLLPRNERSRQKTITAAGFVLFLICSWIYWTRPIEQEPL